MNFLFQKNRKKISAKNLVVGLNLSNNGSICILKDGEVDFYLESERITRKKYDTNVKPLLDYIDGTPDIIAVSDCCWEQPSKELISKRDIAAVKRRFPDSKFLDYSQCHHKVHAAAGWYNSGFDEAVAIVVDANGSKTDEGIEIETVYHLPSWEVLHKKYFTKEDIGIGKKFEQYCIRYGWNINDAGKVMGMAAYSQNPYSRSPSWIIQNEWVYRALDLAQYADGKDLILTGGCFLNCVVNYELRKELDQKIYAEPVAHDGGTAIGAAYLAYSGHT
tara:strand:- start:415 stop:1242 length:828 start_codon:yes stop_codon:yes gene_type:complete